MAIFLVSAAIALYGSWRSPIPGVNEPHYLCKARHFWDPEWLAGDLFLESSNAHWVFYATIGSLTRFLSLERTALVGRALAWGAVAVGWVAMTVPLVRGAWGPVCGIAFFLALATIGNLSGEWLIGGVEAKVFAYAALFLALARAFRRKGIEAAAWCGAATSFHPIVGVWGTISLTFACGWRWFEARRAKDDAVAENFRFAGAIAPVLIFSLLSLPGLVPAVGLVLGGAAPDVSRAADELQVFQRLDHHLDPKQFKTTGWVMYGAMLAGWLAMQPWRRRSAAQRLWFRFVVATLLIAATGMVVGFGPRWAKLLKFYPFRLADLFLPLAVALEAARYAGVLATVLSRRSSAARIFGHAIAALAFAWAMTAPAVDRNPTGWTTRQRADWRDVCQWTLSQTPADALFLTPRFKNYTFKWYAERKEYATWKDCPQDATSLVEWQRRLDTVRRWRAKHYRSGFTPEALEELRQATGVDYVVDWYIQPYRAEPVYRNDSFRVYCLAGPPGE